MHPPNIQASFPRKRESRDPSSCHLPWTPAFAGVTITCRTRQVELVEPVSGAGGNPGSAREKRREIVAKADDPVLRLLRLPRRAPAPAAGCGNSATSGSATWSLGSAGLARSRRGRDAPLSLSRCGGRAASGSARRGAARVAGARATPAAAAIATGEIELGGRDIGHRLPAGCPCRSAAGSRRRTCRLRAPPA